MNVNIWPDLFIVGAPKTGTSSLYAYLMQHPGVMRSVIKEPHFFSNDIDIENFSSDFNYYKIKDIDQAIANNRIIHSSYIRKEADYLKLYKNTQGLLTIDSSVSYLYSKVAAQNIFDKNPNARIIIIIRQPVERAFSHYVMDLKSEHNSNLSFIQEVQRDVRKEYKGWGISHLYVELSTYADSIKRYLDLFPKEQVKIIMYDDYVRNTLQIIEEIRIFTGLTSFHFNTEKKYNTAALPRNFFFKWLNRKKDFKRKIFRIIPDELRHRLRQLAYEKKNLPILTDADYAALMPYFIEDIHKTSVLTGYSLNHWIK